MQMRGHRVKTRSVLGSKNIDKVEVRLLKKKGFGSQLSFVCFCFVFILHFYQNDECRVFVV